VTFGPAAGPTLRVGWRQEVAVSDSPHAPRRSGVDLYWLPLGAGDNTHCVRTNGHAYEALCAWREHRDRQHLFHAALVVHLDGQRFTIEMAPAWSPLPDREHVVACSGPVGLRVLGRSRWFTYEVRSWRDGVIPDLDEAIDSPRRVSDEREVVARVLDLLPVFPTATWGRDELRAGEMWNSNSLIAWVLTRSGVDASVIAPPDGGRAPGWAAGLVVAARERADRGAPA
jgi:hypothetical protein